MPKDRCPRCNDVLTSNADSHDRAVCVWTRIESLMAQMAASLVAMNATLERIAEDEEDDDDD